MGHRVLLVDPPAYTPPYDHALAGALCELGVDVSLLTSRFPHGPVPDPTCYQVDEMFYRRLGDHPSARLRRFARIAQHVPDMVRLRRRTDAADLVHYQWLPVAQLDHHLIHGDVPSVMTMHWRLPEPNSRVGHSYRKLLRSMDHVIIHSNSGRDRLVAEFDVAADQVSVIPHGVFDYLTRFPDPAPLPPELAAVTRKVVLAFGLIRPYKGTELLIEAISRIENAELWVVGSARMPIEPLVEQAAPLGDRVRFVNRFVPDEAVPAFFRRADLVALPYHHIEQSGVLYTALAFGKPMVLSDVGGFPEIAAHGAAKIVPAGDAVALAAAITELLDDPAKLRQLSNIGLQLAASKYSWQSIARSTIAVYDSVIQGSPRTPS